MERGWYWRTKYSFCCYNTECPALFSKQREQCCVAGDEGEHRGCCLPEPTEERPCSSTPRSLGWVVLLSHPVHGWCCSGLGCRAGWRWIHLPGSSSQVSGTGSVFSWWQDNEIKLSRRADPPQVPKVNLTVCIDFSCFSLNAGLGLPNPSFGSQFKLLLLIAVRTWSGPVRDSVCHCFHLQLYHFLRLLGFFFIFD